MGWSSSRSPCRRPNSPRRAARSPLRRSRRSRAPSATYAHFIWRNGLPRWPSRPSPGVRCEQLIRPIDAVGLYVPAGRAPLPSTVIMLAVPSEIAGCPRRVLCTPPSTAGTAHPAVLVAAELSGIDTVFKVGGAQAIAALAYGTQSLPKVEKIFGPGNVWVTTAKQLVAQDPGGAACDQLF